MVASLSSGGSFPTHHTITIAHLPFRPGGTGRTRASSNLGLTAAFSSIRSQYYPLAAKTQPAKAVIHLHSHGY